MKINLFINNKKLIKQIQIKLHNIEIVNNTIRIN